MAIPISYNYRNVVNRPVATLTTAVGIGLTVAIFVGALALAQGFQVALRETGSPANALAMRKGADSELSSGVMRDAANIIRSNPAVASAPDGRPLFSPEVVVLMNLPRLGQPGYSNVTVRGLDPDALALRNQVKIVEGRMFAPGASEVIVSQRIATRFANCRIGDKLRFKQQDFAVVGHFTSGGSSFESEIWGDNAVLMPVFRGDVFQSVTFRMKDPSQFPALKKELEADPRLGVQLKRESEYYAEQSEMLANIIRFAGVFITLDHGDWRGVRRHEHHVRGGRGPHARDRDAAGAGFQPVRDHGLVHDRVRDPVAVRRPARLPAVAVHQRHPHRHHELSDLQRIHVRIHGDAADPGRTD